MTRQIQLPDLDTGGRGVGGGRESSRRGSAFRKVANGENDLCGVEAEEMTGSFETQASIRAGNDDGLAGEIGSGVGEGDEELGVEEGGYVGHCSRFVLGVELEK